MKNLFTIQGDFGKNLPIVLELNFEDECLSTLIMLWLEKNIDKFVEFNEFHSCNIEVSEDCKNIWIRGDEDFKEFTIEKLEITKLKWSEI